MAQDSDENGELPLISAGRRLREAREAQGLGLDAISAQTKIARRHLEAIEADHFSGLASRTYAIGFSRAYARALGLDEERIAENVRDQIEAEHSTRPNSHTQNFQPGDPARVPPSTLAWAAALGFLAAIVALFVFWRSFVDPAGEIPDLVSETPGAATASPSAGPGSVPPGAKASEAQGPVVLTALQDRVWIKITDASGGQIYQKELVQGERFTVPSDAQGPVLATARPDALGISIGGGAAIPLADKPALVRDVPLDPESLLAKARPSSSAAPSQRAAAQSAAPAAQ